MDSFESSTLKKYRRLSQFLIVSALFNIAFGASALYQYFKPVKPLEWTNSKSAISEDSVAVLKNFLNLSYPELISKLGVKSEIEPGLHKRDIALAILHQSYQVDIARALNRPLLSFQHLSFTDGAKEKTLPVRQPMHWKMRGSESLIQQLLLGEQQKQDMHSLTKRA